MSRSDRLGSPSQAVKGTDNDLGCMAPAKKLSGPQSTITQPPNLVPGSHQAKTAAISKAPTPAPASRSKVVKKWPKAEAEKQRAGSLMFPSIHQKPEGASKPEVIDEHPKATADNHRINSLMLPGEHHRPAAATVPQANASSTAASNVQSISPPKVSANSQEKKQKISPSTSPGPQDLLGPAAPPIAIIPSIPLQATEDPPVVKGISQPEPQAEEKQSSWKRVSPREHYQQPVASVAKPPVINAAYSTANSQEQFRECTARMTQEAEIAAVQVVQNNLTPYAAKPQHVPGGMQQRDFDQQVRVRTTAHQGQAPNATHRVMGNQLSAPIPLPALPSAVRPVVSPIPGPTQRQCGSGDVYASPHSLPGAVPQAGYSHNGHRARPIQVARPNTNTPYMGFHSHPQMPYANGVPMQPPRIIRGHNSSPIGDFQQLLGPAFLNDRTFQETQHLSRDILNTTGPMQGFQSAPIHPNHGFMVQPNPIPPNIYNTHRTPRPAVPSAYQESYHAQPRPTGLAAHSLANFAHQSPAPASQPIYAQHSVPTQPQQAGMTVSRGPLEVTVSMNPNVLLHPAALTPQGAALSSQQAARYPQQAPTSTTASSKASRKRATSVKTGTAPKETKPRAPRKPKLAQNAMEQQSPGQYNTALPHIYNTAMAPQLPQVQTAIAVTQQRMRTAMVPGPQQLRTPMVPRPPPSPSLQPYVRSFPVAEAMGFNDDPRFLQYGKDRWKLTREYIVFAERTPLLAGIMRKAGFMQGDNFHNFEIDNNIAEKPSLKALEIVEPYILKKILGFAAETVDVITVEPPRDPTRLRSTIPVRPDNIAPHPSSSIPSLTPTKPPYISGHSSANTPASANHSNPGPIQHSPMLENIMHSPKRKGMDDSHEDLTKRQKKGHENTIEPPIISPLLKRKAEDDAEDERQTKIYKSKSPKSEDGADDERQKKAYKSESREVGDDPEPEGQSKICMNKSPEAADRVYYFTRVETSLRLVCKWWSQALSGKEVDLRNLSCYKVRVSESLFEQGVPSKMFRLGQYYQCQITFSKMEKSETIGQVPDNQSRPNTILPDFYRAVDFRFVDGISEFCPRKSFGADAFAYWKPEIKITVPAKTQAGFMMPNGFSRFSASPGTLNLRLYSWIKGSEMYIPLEVNELVRHFEHFSDNSHLVCPRTIMIQLPKTEFELKRFVNSWHSPRVLKADVPAIWNLEKLGLFNFNTAAWKGFQYSANIVPGLIRSVFIWLGNRLALPLHGKEKVRKLVDKATEHEAFDLEIFAPETWQRSLNGFRFHDVSDKPVEYGGGPQLPGQECSYLYMRSNAYPGERQSWDSLELILLVGSESELRADEHKIAKELVSRFQAGAKLNLVLKPRPRR